MVFFFDGLFIEPSKGMPFCIEVGYFDTMKEIKEKVAKYHGIPVYEQTLIFKDTTLPDDLNIHNSDIFDRSRIHLHINNNNNGDHPKVIVKTEKEEEQEEEEEENKSTMMIKLAVKNGGLTRMMEVDMNDSVLKLKEKIYNEMELGGGGGRMYANGIEILHDDDHKTLRECQLQDGSEVEIITTPQLTIKQHQPTTSTTILPLPPLEEILILLLVNVMSKCGKKIALEMNPLNNVGELRKELHKVIRNSNGSFRLPEDGYFFIYKQNVMEEDQSFRWHRVAQGDTIEIFNGCVTGGGS
ncbi:hypothetical protein OSB04_012428 [Centaurea solstitialis]|uniref:Ubiquitin-like domain-containing protein n=1 Tax=Centaurea solstitialis TaxID=347529 RepID=A0AA38TD25_9ASTR|nr:hypothetical protein OSB04_012428 [Centaurea solstitialis]